MKNEIIWNENGWTSLQNADANLHVLGISCLTENGMVTQIRKRHNDGEEIIIRDKINDEYKLPMPLKDFKKAYLKKKIQW